MRLTPSLHRLGEAIVSCYLLEEAGEVTVIDAADRAGGAVPDWSAATGRARRANPARWSTTWPTATARWPTRSER